MSLQFSSWSKVTNVLEAYDLWMTYFLSLLIFCLPLFILVFFNYHWEKLATDDIIEEEELREIQTKLQLGEALDSDHDQKKIDDSIF